MTTALTIGGNGFSGLSGSSFSSTSSSSFRSKNSRRKNTKMLNRTGVVCSSSSVMDPYKTLKIRPDSSEYEVKKAFRQLAKKYHPDVCRGSNCGVQFQTINEAYDIVLKQIKIVWNKGGIPKHSFLVWLFVLNRCPTKDRILTWGLPVDPMCVLCNSDSESRSHLYFDCPFAWSIWSEVCARCGIQPSREWDATIQLLLNLQATRMKKKLVLLVWQCTIYLIWQERNSRIHRQTFKSGSSIVAGIDALVRNYCASRRETQPARSSELYQLWMGGEIR